MSEPLPDLSGLPVPFVWGAATSAFQIEGAADRRGESIWDTFCREPGRIRDGSDATTACDHVHRYVEDVALLRGLGVDAYRFSVSWPRVQPGGRGQLAADGLGFYDRLVDELLGAGIEPWVTLYHWDLPQELQDAGGWPARDTAQAFADYAASVHAALGDRVRYWMTLNEPWCSAWLGHASGEHAPGVHDLTAASRSAHHLLLGHGLAVAAMRAQAPADHSIGIVLNLGAYRPADGLDAEQRAAVAGAADVLDGVQTRWWLDALLRGHYPLDTLDLLTPYLGDAVRDGDLALVAQPLDFLGINYYRDELLSPRGADGTVPVPELPGTEGVWVSHGASGSTSIGWPVTPDGLRALLVRVAEEYPGVPLVITENGSAWHDSRSALQVRQHTVSAPAAIPDPARVAYLHAHLAAASAAAGAGVDLRGYFAWSLLDNFEWAHGYTQQFGLVRVDFDTGERRLRHSYEAYRDLITVQRG